MRAPLEYGDNFPVAGSWDPTTPWRFPRIEVQPRERSLLDRVIPWVTLGLGVTLGVLWMSWRADLPGKGAAEEQEVRGAVRQGERIRTPSVLPAKRAPSARPYRPRSRVV